MKESSEITYRTKTASLQEILANLKNCDKDYSPPLSTRVNLQEYAQKLFEKSITFEAWSDNRLIGMVAAYFNDLNSMNGFITNVCVENEFHGKHVGSELIGRCIQFGIENKFKNIYLEVNKYSKAAISLYEKYEFKLSGINHDSMEMILNLNTDKLIQNLQ
jgi:ribosomal-protein-alanine N-acetyltransferase